MIHGLLHPHDLWALVQVERVQGQVQRYLFLLAELVGRGLETMSFLLDKSRRSEHWLVLIASEYDNCQTQSHPCTYPTEGLPGRYGRILQGPLQNDTRRTV